MNTQFYNLYRIGYHKPTEDTLPRFQTINDAFQKCAVELDAVIPECADKTVAFRYLEFARMLANQAVAVGDQPMFVDIN